MPPFDADPLSEPRHSIARLRHFRVPSPQTRQPPGAVAVPAGFATPHAREFRDRLAPIFQNHMAHWVGIPSGYRTPPWGERPS
jgi:hypothetical protein